MTILRILGGLWSLPIAVIGLLWSLVCRPQRAWWNGETFCLEMRVRWLPMRAWGETWGRLILYTIDDPQRIRPHELEHVRQGSILGPLFIIAYPLASLVALIRGKHFYLDNWFEVRARAAAARQEKS